MFGPIMEMLRQPVGGRHMRKLLRLAEGLAVLVKHPCRRIAQSARISRTERVARQGSFQRLVMVRGRTFRPEGTREETGDPLPPHDERPPAPRRIFIRLAVGAIRGGPRRG